MRKMKRMVSRIVLGMALLLMCTVTSPAPNPGFTECSPSGYNCNILITLGKNGSLTVTSNPNMPYYPTPAGWTDIGSLIGFKNSSNSAVYSIGLNATPGDPYEAAWICGPNTTANYNAPNVQIINSPHVRTHRILRILLTTSITLVRTVRPLGRRLVTSPSQAASREMEQRTLAFTI